LQDIGMGKRNRVDHACKINVSPCPSRLARTLPAHAGSMTKRHIAAQLRTDSMHRLESAIMVAGGHHP
ncbi:hypothetical protein, partial [Xanthomonas cannabis]|uniref:hypothetical protein n=1 Tax=Xanthomonas cannabis TaxID=1885674 RepID=UPI00195119FE